MFVGEPRVHFRRVQPREKILKVRPPNSFISFTDPFSRKHEILTRSLRKMERTLDTVLRSIGNPSIASGMISRSPSPSAQTAGTQALLAQSPSPPPAPTFHNHPSNHKHNQIPPGSPKLHSLPDNSLNPLGLLAEASLANRRAQINTTNSGLMARETGDDENPKLGVASDNYFKPGTVVFPRVNLPVLTYNFHNRSYDNIAAAKIVY